MTAPLLRAVGEASLSAAVMILAVLALRLRFQDRTPRRIFCLLWDIVLVRLLVLGALPSPVSIRQWLPELSAKPAAVPQGPMVVGMVESVLVQKDVLIPQVEGITYLAEGTVAAGTAPPSLDWGMVLTGVWLAVALLLAGGFLWSHLRSRKVYAASLPCRERSVLDWLAAHPLYRPVQARVSDRIAAPLTYGVLYPVILLPRGMDWEDQSALACVLAHEHTHIRRFDALRKVFLAAALCLHWFDPLVWAMYVLADRDIELACDEAVLRGGADRERYALALLSMEERRGRWSPSGSHFSRNALEERIKAIMKRKHISITALVAVLVVMCITTTVFASAAPEEKSAQNAPVTGYANSIVEDIGVTILSKGGEDGEKLYSDDGGKTWMNMEQYNAKHGSWGDGWQVEWWTYEDYKAWLEQEKKDLQDMIGAKGYTGSRGWFTWDQQIVDETIALYEGILEEIKNGALYSKTIIDKNGNEVEDVALGTDGPMDMVIASTFDDSEIVRVEPKAVDEAALLEELKAFGIGGNANLMTYNGELVRTFVDGVSVGDSGYSIQYVYTNPDGAVDLHTLRSVIHDPDGSYDAMGDLIGVAARGDQGYDPELIEAAASGSKNAVPETSVASTRFASNPGGSLARDDGFDVDAFLEELKAFGVTGAADELYYKGQLVRSLMDGAEGRDEDYSYYTFWTSYANPDGTVNLQVKREGDVSTGKIVDVVSQRDAGFDTKMFELYSMDDMYWRSFGSLAPENGETFDTIFAKYEKYGLVYLPRECGIGSISYNGQPVRSFADLKPDGGVFSFTDSYVPTGLKVSTLYDADGRLMGLSVDDSELADLPVNMPELRFDYAAPVQGTLSAPFGLNNGEMHHGVDIAAEKGTDVKSFAYGVVTESGFDATLGNYVVVSHQYGFSTLYAHCDSIAVTTGTTVAMGEKIAEVGSSGMATGPVLHFELRTSRSSNQTCLDPCAYLEWKV